MNVSDGGCGIGIISGGGSPLSSIAGRRTCSLSPDINGDCFVRGRMAAFSLESHPSSCLSRAQELIYSGGSSGYYDDDANKEVERPELRASNVQWMLDALESSNVRFDVASFDIVSSA